MLINATPRTINILSLKGVELNVYTKSYLAAKEDIEVVKNIPASGIIPKIQISKISRDSICGIPTEELTFKEIENLPDQQEGVFYIVSALVAITAKAKGRTDYLIPSKLVRNGEEPSEILGYLVLARY